MIVRIATSEIVRAVHLAGAARDMLRHCSALILLDLWDGWKPRPSKKLEKVGWEPDRSRNPSRFLRPIPTDHNPKFDLQADKPLQEEKL